MSIDVTRLDAVALLQAIHPGFFDQPNIRALPEGRAWEEMALDLRAFSPEAVSIPAPEGVAYGFYRGDMAALRRVVREVDEGWPALFDGRHRVYCAFDGDRVASFCLVEDMGRFGALRVGGPGCVGTAPAFRRRGIGLRMVLNVTALLKGEGFDLAYIHYTGVAPWYARLGYRTLLRWDRNGPLADPAPGRTPPKGR